MQWVNGVEQDVLSLQDRGLLYGDGVFRSFRLRSGRAWHWTWAWARFCADARALALAVPDEAQVLRCLATIGERLPEAIIRLTLTRGVGARGFLYAPDAEPTWIVQASPYVAQDLSAGVHLFWAKTRQALQPSLAGIKHLNRLENVLARNEQPDYFDGLMCDMAGRVIEATSANLAIVRAGRWQTPCLAQSGVAGGARAWFLQHCPDCTEVDLYPEDILQAEELWLMNLVRGWIPVRRLGDHDFGGDFAQGKIFAQRFARFELKNVRRKRSFMDFPADKN